MKKIILTLAIGLCSFQGIGQDISTYIKNNAINTDHSFVTNKYTYHLKYLKTK